MLRTALVLKTFSEFLEKKNIDLVLEPKKGRMRGGHLTVDYAGDRRLLYFLTDRNGGLVQKGFLDWPEGKWLVADNRGRLILFDHGHSKRRDWALERGFCPLQTLYGKPGRTLMSIIGWSCILGPGARRRIGFSIACDANGRRLFGKDVWDGRECLVVIPGIRKSDGRFPRDKMDECRRGFHPRYFILLPCGFDGTPGFDSRRWLAWSWRKEKKKQLLAEKAARIQARAAAIQKSKKSQARQKRCLTAQGPPTSGRWQPFRLKT